MTPAVPKESNRDPEYLAFRDELCRLWRAPCFVCNARNNTVVTHHVRGKRRHGDKWNCVYLCSTCHGEIHHLGRHTFCRVNRISFEELVEQAKHEYDEYLKNKHPRGDAAG